MTTKLLIHLRIVVEVSLTCYATSRLLRTPHLLLTSTVREWLWECRRRRWEGTTLFCLEVLLVVEAEVQVKAVWVAVVLLLLLLLVGHDRQ